MSQSLPLISERSAGNQYEVIAERKIHLWTLLQYLLAWLAVTFFWHDLSSLSLLSRFVHEVNGLKLSAEVPYLLFNFLRRFRRDQSREYDDGASANHLT